MISWDDVRRRLEEELVTLGPDDFVVVGEPDAPAEPRRGLLRRRASTPPRRYAQVRHDGDLFYAECVGATRFGGEWPVTDDQHGRLRELGWFVPGEGNPWDHAVSYPNYFCFDVPAQAARLAGLCATSLELLGAEPASLEWRGAH